MGLAMARIASIGTTIRRLWHDGAGAEVIAFGLIAPLLLLMSIGVLDFGRALWIDSTINYAAREAARYASIRGAHSDAPASNSQITSVAVAKAVGAGLTSSDVTVAWSPDNQPGSSVTVRVSVKYNFWMSGLLPLPAMQLQSTSTRTVF